MRRETQTRIEKSPVKKYTILNKFYHFESHRICHLGTILLRELKQVIEGNTPRLNLKNSEKHERCVLSDMPNANVTTEGTAIDLGKTVGLSGPTLSSQQETLMNGCFRTIQFCEICVATRIGIAKATERVQRESVGVRENEKSREIATFFPSYVLEVAKIFS